MDLKTITDYIENKIEENLNLDYKASDSLQRNDKKTNEISKDVSAFANSDGGIIIYGVKEDPINRHLPQSLDPINRKEISKEWLEQIIQSKISPRINNVKIHAITVDEVDQQVIYVVEIPKSDTAHQASDRKYYRRFNFNSEPMYDYEIRDILNRSKHPLINLSFELVVHRIDIEQSDFALSFPEMGIDRLRKTFNSSPEQLTTYTLNIYAKNDGKVLANYLNAYVDIPGDCLKEPDYYSMKEGMVSIFLDNTIRDIVDVQFNGMHSNTKYGPSRYDPILPRTRLRLKEIKILDNFLYLQNPLEWIVYCDNAEPVTGSISISDIKVVEKNGI